MYKRQTYIIAENDVGLVLIDQCILHQCLLYETFVEAIQKNEVPVESFSTSLLLELTPQESILIEQNLEPLSISGFALSPFGGNTFAINSFPNFLLEDQVKKVISKILERSSLFLKNVRVEEFLKDIALTVAEFASIKPDQILELAEMECLLAQWEALGSPLSFMQDKPLLVEISLKELEKKLRI